MDKQIFDKFREIVYSKSGISLGEGKEALVSARIGRRMRLLGIHDHRVYLDHVIRDATGEEIVHLLDAISTNVTSFFRESIHFDFIAKSIGELIAEGQKRFRIWSAACSTGEEPYTLAMVLREATQVRSLDIRILATDISTRVLEKAQEGVYEADKVDGIPPVLRERYFERYYDDKDVCYVAKRELRAMITFKRLNLSAPPFPMRGPFDIILCRNVMIYFDNAVRRRLLIEMYRLLRQGGYLMVGHAESLTGVVGEFRVVRPSIYSK